MQLFRRNEILTVSQKNFVMKLVKQAGFNPAEFHWEERKINVVRYPSKIRVRVLVDTLVNNPEGYYFVFGRESKKSLYWTDYYPAWAVREEYNMPVNGWEDQLRDLEHWFASLNRAMNRTDSIAVPVKEGKSERKKFRSYTAELQSRRKEQNELDVNNDDIDIADGDPQNPTKTN